MAPPYEIWLQTAQCFFVEEKFENVESDLGQRSMNYLDLGLSEIAMSYLVTNFHLTDFKKQNGPNLTWL